MAAIDTGTHAPDFTWPGFEGKTSEGKTSEGKTYSLKTALASGPVLAAFFKVSCPTCQYTFPFLERIAKHFGCVWGVSQDDARATRDFAKHYGVSFPLLLEDTDDYPTSNAYGLTHVPSIFLIGRSGEILASCVGFSQQDLLDIVSKLAKLTGKEGLELFHAGEDIPKFKSG
jgi:peroxiredoxin